ncbi:hypothetical protein ACFFQW_14830 [Umezawaea endophytica]|uniref:Uncharacterized protein n=1 Tax=Umezawaea endophytica TaxID=1654476 RepID=A0A9X2VJJ7_9PSEU|nr:hypothetical protein [Umezawaea endophytica]MCS7477798.1 hypothetical protein [Umezawaea endophytica]
MAGELTPVESAALMDRLVPVLAFVRDSIFDDLPHVSDQAKRRAVGVVPRGSGSVFSHVKAQIAAFGEGELREMKAVNRSEFDDLTCFYYGTASIRYLI